MFDESSLKAAAAGIVMGTDTSSLLPLRSTLAVALIEEPDLVKTYQETLVKQTIAAITDMCQPQPLRPDEATHARTRLRRDINQAKDAFYNLMHNELASVECKEFAQATIDKLFTLEPETKELALRSPAMVNVDLAELMQRFITGMAQLPPYQILQTIQMYMDNTNTPEARSEYTGLLKFAGAVVTPSSYGSLLLDAVKVTTEKVVLAAVYAVQAGMDDFNRNVKQAQDGTVQSFPSFNY